MKQLVNDVKAMTLIGASAAVSIGATALFLSAEPSNQEADCLANLPEAASSISISPGGVVTVVRMGGGEESLTLCSSVEDQGRKRRKRRRHQHADQQRERMQVRVMEARERAEEAVVRAQEARVRSDEARVRVGEIEFRIQEAMERTEEARRRAAERAIESEVFGEHEIEDAIEKALESIDMQEIEAAIERALESVDEDEIEDRVEEQLERLERRLERVGNGGN
ncbi:MAG: hypothetical protein ACR2QM_08210 [Longimicrobiales bacterium]